MRWLNAGLAPVRIATIAMTLLEGWSDYNTALGSHVTSVRDGVEHVLSEQEKFDIYFRDGCLRILPFAAVAATCLTLLVWPLAHVCATFPVALAYPWAGVFGGVLAAIAFFVLGFLLWWLPFGTYPSFMSLVVGGGVAAMSLTAMLRWHTMTRPTA